ncbi:MAG TPA: 3-oxoacyl-ACP reductase FabG [Candidatus Dormibacteraeota bacterium]|jgi:3-oxoacyl-[acyl-carrier protein] reductase
MLQPIAGRVAVVTGGSRGIGKGIARTLARHGVRVLIASRGADAARGVVDEIRSAGGTAEHVTADVSVPDDVPRIAEAALEHFGAIDILCSNAGIFPPRSLRELTAAEIDEVFNVNLRGTMLVVKACLPALERSGHGRVILTSSITGPVTGYPGWSHYGASKAGQLGFMRTVAMEVAGAGITVNAVLPGNIKTEGLADLGEEYERTMAAAIPLKRLGTVDDVANTVVFLASDEAAYLTGVAIVVDGGQILPESLAALEG